MTKPLYPQLNYKRQGVVGRDLLKALAQASGLPQMASDAYWSFTHPVDRVTGKGRAANPKMEMPWGPSAAVALPGFAGRFGRLFGKPATIRKRVEQANADRIIFGGGSQWDWLEQLQKLEGKPKPGRTYRVPIIHGADPPQIPGRIAIIQDPQTGSMFAAPGALHGEIIQELARRTGSSPQYTKWLQHEVHPGGQMGGFDMPSRLSWMIHEGKDTKKATVARMRLIENMRKAGMIPAKHESRPRDIRSRLARSKTAFPTYTPKRKPPMSFEEWQKKQK